MGGGQRAVGTTPLGVEVLIYIPVSIPSIPRGVVPNGIYNSSWIYPVWALPPPAPPRTWARMSNTRVGSISSSRNPHPAPSPSSPTLDLGTISAR